MEYLAVFKDLFGTIECPIHSQKPEIIKDDDGELVVSTCCPKFKKECLFLISKIVALMAKP